MARFEYRAATNEGNIVDGVLHGDDREQVVKKLQTLGHIPIRVSEAREEAKTKKRLARRPRKITRQQIGEFTRELATLLQAGLPLDKALQVLESLAQDEAIVEVLASVREKVKGGSTLADAMENSSSAFGRLYLSLLRAGEAGGALEMMLERLAEHIETTEQMRASLQSALIYPAILVFVAMFSIFILLGYVVPQFTQMFDGVGQALPVSTRFIITLGEVLQNFGWLLILALAGLIWWAKKQLASPTTARKWHERLLRLPIAGEIAMKIEVARFARTLSMLLTNGIPLLGAMDIVRNSAGNLVLVDGFEKVTADLREGKNMAGTLSEVPYFPSFAAHMISVGEQSGDLESILTRIADSYENSTRESIKRAMTMLEPMLILILGAIIAGVIISILAAILSINELVV